MEILCKNLNDTKELAVAFSRLVKNSGAFVTLKGSIGAGKTAFVRFLLKELGVQETITSPTFVILNEYHGENHIPIYHFDLYRLENEGVKTILCELEEYSKRGVLTLVEWADFAEEQMPEERIDIQIACLENEQVDARKFVINAFGSLSTKEIVEKLEKECGVLI